ncbi:MAG: hypothetical protein NTW29_05540 [Bacteroidetes bacterium]|nr:hypothetical protein [Bacteroidota bacterium]
MQKVTLIILSFFVLVSFRPGTRYYCACCAERGDHYTESVKIDKEKLSLLQEMKMNKGTDIYMNEGEEEWFKGIKSIENAYNEWAGTDTVTGNKFFSTQSNVTAKTWKFSFTTANGKTGTLNLAIPLKMESFGVDIHEGDENSMVVLYKEYRIKGTVQSATGFCSSGLTKPASYTLILQGRGNFCENATDYTHWRLAIKGAAADYILMGTFNTKE